MLNENDDPTRDAAWLAGETAAAMHDLARTVTGAPPLRLTADTARLSPSRARHRARAARHWWPWLAPLTAAAAVAVLAIALVLIRDIPNGGVVPPNPATSIGASGAPRYYVAVQPAGGNMNGSLVLVVGDSLTGTTLATIAPPSGVTFGGVSGAADDRTFVVQALARSGSATVSEWFEVRLAPGTANPARLTPLPIKAQPAPTASSGNPEAAAVARAFPTALATTGQEIAVAEVTGAGGMAVKVFSVATGLVLHEWTSHDPSLSVSGDAAHGLDTAPTLTWIDGDRALALTTLGQPTRSGTITVDRQTVRRLSVSGPASGDLIADSEVLRDVEVGGHETPAASCGDLFDWPPLVSADGKTFTCSSLGAFFSYPLTAGTTAVGHQDKIDHPVTQATVKGISVSGLLWTSPSGDALVGEWGASDNSIIPTVGHGLQIGVISHGRFTPLRFPTGFTPVTGAFIAW
ncbi:MAG: hypothetical protein ACRDP7_42915 [Trebonia sp.]